MKVVLNAGPIIHLSWIHRLDLLNELFEEVFLPPAIRDEVLAAPPGNLGLDQVQTALSQGRLAVRELSAISQHRGDAPSSIDRGEAEAILLAEEVNRSGKSGGYNP